MSFYDPMQSGPDFGGGIQELMQQFMMMKMIQAMYPGKTTEELSTSPLPEKRDVKNLFHSLGINPGDESELPGESRVGSYVRNPWPGLVTDYSGLKIHNPWAVSDLLKLYPPAPKFPG